MCMGKNNNGLVYCWLINNCTVFVNHNTVCLCSTLTFYGRYSTVVVFDLPTQNTINIIVVFCMGGSKTKTVFVYHKLMSHVQYRNYSSVVDKYSIVALITLSCVSPLLFFHMDCYQYIDLQSLLLH